MVSTLVKGSILVATIASCICLQQKQSQVESHWLKLLHLISFSSWFGCSVWVTFISGIIMFKNLERHTFGRLQSKLFPAYFQFSTLCILLSIASSSTSISTSGDQTLFDKIQQYSLMAILATILLNLLWLEPATTRIMYERHAVEKRLGTGHEIGQLKPKDPQKANDPQLKALSKKFGMYHGMSSLSNLIALGLGCLWMNKLTQQSMN